MRILRHRYGSAGRPADRVARSIAILAVVAGLLLACGDAAGAQRAPRVADLRCLTSNPDHCLPEAMTPEEPHGAVCSTCHNLWEQRQLSDAKNTCATSDCHARPETLTPYHRGLPAGVLQECTGCHAAHDVRIAGGGATCSTCHTSGGVRAAKVERPGRSLDVHRVSASFQHDRHGRVACNACHTAAQRHGRLAVRQIQDCRSCHHTERSAQGCLSCHSGSEPLRNARQVSWTMDLRVGSLDRPRRQLPFEHSRHLEVGCETCHSGGTARVTSGANCSGCHEQHHRPTANCSSCHVTPVDGAHDRTSHLGCAGSGCHQAAMASMPELTRARTSCLMCHGGRTDHEPGSNCADCHILPKPRPPGSLTAR
jgi:hypothetical protein